MSTFPVSGSTSTSTMLPAKAGPTRVGLELAEALMGPPVRSCFPATSFQVSRFSFSREKTPSSKPTSSTSASSRMAARSRICCLTSSAAVIVAMPVENAVRLPPVTPVQPTESVSPTVGWTSSTPSPSTSAACIARTALIPPISTEPVTRAIVPSALTVTVAEDWLPPLNQKPMATPRPRFGPSIGAE